MFMFFTANLREHRLLPYVSRDRIVLRTIERLHIGLLGMHGIFRSLSFDIPAGPTTTPGMNHHYSVYDSNNCSRRRRFHFPRVILPCSSDEYYTGTYCRSVSQGFLEYRYALNQQEADIINY